MRRLLLVLPLVLAACAGAPVSNEPAAERPVSEQPAVGDARIRAKAHTDLGMTYFQGRQFGVAIEEGRVALAADPDYAPAYNLLALVHMYLGENALALVNFQKANGLAQNDPEINNNYGMFLCTQGREREGIALLMRAARNALYRTPTRPHYNAGLCALRMQDDKLAEEQFRQALLADGTNAGAYYQLADIAYRRGEHLAARQFLSEVHRLIDPTAESVWLALRVERKLGDRQAEANFTSQLRRKFAGTPQHQALLQGQYE